MTCYKYGPELLQFQSINDARRWYADNMEDGTKAELWRINGPEDGIMVGTMMMQLGKPMYLPMGRTLIQTVKEDGSLMSEAEMDREMKKHNAMTRRE